MSLLALTVLIVAMVVLGACSGPSAYRVCREYKESRAFCFVWMLPPR